MSAGLYPMSVIAEFLGQRPEEMTARIELDQMPAIKVPTATRPAFKVSLLAFHTWLKGHSVNAPLTVPQLQEELARCAAAVTERTRAKAERKKEKSKEKIEA